MRMMHHLAYMALRMFLYPVLTIAYQVGRFAFLVQIGFDMTFLFVFENFIDGDQDAGLFHLPELMVDSGAEYTHLRGEAHISIDQRRHIDAELADFLVQDLVIVLEVVILESSCIFSGSVPVSNGQIGVISFSGSGKCMFRKYRIMLRASEL